MRVIFDREKLTKNSYIDNEEFFLDYLKTWLNSIPGVMQERIASALKDKDGVQLLIDINKFESVSPYRNHLSQSIHNTLILKFVNELEQYLNSSKFNKDNINYILRESYFKEIRLESIEDAKYINEIRGVNLCTINDLYVLDDWINSLKKINWYPSQIIINTFSNCGINNLYVPKDNAVGFFNKTSFSLSGTYIKNIIYI